MFTRICFFITCLAIARCLAGCESEMDSPSPPTVNACQPLPAMFVLDKRTYNNYYCDRICNNIDGGNTCISPTGVTMDCAKCGEQLPSCGLTITSFANCLAVDGSVQCEMCWIGAEQFTDCNTTADTGINVDCTHNGASGHF